MAAMLRQAGPGLTEVSRSTVASRSNRSSAGQTRWPRAVSAAGVPPRAMAIPPGELIGSPGSSRRWPAARAVITSVASW